MKKRILSIVLIIMVLFSILCNVCYAAEPDTYEDINGLFQIDLPNQFKQSSNFSIKITNGTETIGSQMNFEWKEKDVGVIAYTINKENGIERNDNTTVLNGCTLGDIQDAWKNDKDILDFKNYIGLTQKNATMFCIDYGKNDSGCPFQRTSWILYSNYQIIDTFAIESDDYVTQIIFHWPGSKAAFDSVNYRNMTIDDWFWNSDTELAIAYSLKYKTTNLLKVCNLDFKDVRSTDWFCDAVRYSFINNVIAGYDEYTFAPFEELTREQLVSLLWRIEGKPDASSLTNDFSDVPNGEWYTDAIKWANENGIVNGYEGENRFGLRDKIIRQDLAKILYNYAVYKNKDVSIGSLNAFADEDSVSNYAINAIGWAAHHEIISGNAMPDGSKTIAPLNNATRAETAVMLYKLCEKVLNVS